MSETDDDDAAPHGPAAAAHVASVTNPSPRASQNALAYFMGEEPPPQSQKRIPLDVNLAGPDDDEAWTTVVLRPLANEEFVAAAKASRMADTGGIDPFVNASFVFAYACLEPELGGVLAARTERGDAGPDGKPFPDTAAIVRDVFRFIPGVVIAAANKLDDLSRTSEDPDKLVRLIEAGKDSP